MYMKKFESVYKKIISQSWFNNPDYQSDLPVAQQQELEEYEDQNPTPERQVEIVRDLLNYLDTRDGYDFLDYVSMNDMIPEVQVQIAKIDDQHIMSQFGISVRSYEGFQTLLNNPQIVGAICAFESKYMPADLLPQFYAKIKLAWEENQAEVSNKLVEWVGVSTPDELVTHLPKRQQQMLLNSINNVQPVQPGPWPKRKPAGIRRPRK